MLEHQQQQNSFYITQFNDLEYRSKALYLGGFFQVAYSDIITKLNLSFTKKT